jgi:hypothetical protein
MQPVTSNWSAERQNQRRFSSEQAATQLPSGKNMHSFAQLMLLGIPRFGGDARCNGVPQASLVAGSKHNATWMLSSGNRDIRLSRSRRAGRDACAVLVAENRAIPVSIGLLWTAAASAVMVLPL